MSLNFILRLRQGKIHPQSYEKIGDIFAKTNIQPTLIHVRHPTTFFFGTKSSKYLATFENAVSGNYLHLNSPDEKYPLKQT